MRVRYLPCLVVLAGCSFTDGAASGTRLGDGNADATCRFSSQFDTCSLSGTNDLVLSGTNTYDTNTGTLMMGVTPIVVTHVVLAGGAGNVDAIVVHDFTMTAGAQLRATGMLPLAIVAFGSASLQAGALVDL